MGLLRITSWSWAVQIYREAGAQTAELTFKNASLCWWKCLSPSKIKSHPTWWKKTETKPKKKRAGIFRRCNQTPVGARRLMKAMLLRHILLKKMGQAGFMMKCSRRIRSSVNKVLRGNRLLKPELHWLRGTTIFIAPESDVNRMKVESFAKLWMSEVCSPICNEV